MTTKSKLVCALLLSLFLIAALTSGPVSEKNDDREVAQLEYGESGYSLFPPEVREAEISILRGLKGVSVSVEEFCGDVKESGLTERNILELVQNQLQKEGVRILSKEEIPKTKSRPNLCAVVKIIKDKNSNLCALNIILQLREEVLLEREGGVNKSGCVSWQVSELVICTSAKLGERIQNDVSQYAERFAKEFVSANSILEKREKAEPMISGTVRYLELEGGFYGLFADDGAKYDPMNLPSEYKKDGLRVQFSVRERKGAMSIHMWGKIVEVVKIQKAVE